MPLANFHEKTHHTNLMKKALPAAALLTSTALALTSCTNNSTTPAGLDSTVRETNNQLRTILAAEPATEVAPIGWNGATQTLTTSTGETHTFPSTNNTSEVKYVMWGSSKSWCMMGVTEQEVSTTYGSGENGVCAEWLTDNPINYKNYINQQAEYDPVNKLWFTVTTPELEELTTEKSPLPTIEVSKDGGNSWEKSVVDPSLKFGNDYVNFSVSCAPVGCLAGMETFKPEPDQLNENTIYSEYTELTTNILSYDAQSSMWIKTGQLPNGANFDPIQLLQNKPLMFNNKTWIAKTISPTTFAMRSNDSGATWEPLSSLVTIPNTNKGQVVKINSKSIAANNGTLFAVVDWEKTEEEKNTNSEDYMNNTGVVRSEDNGNTWTLIPNSFDYQLLTDVIAGAENEWMVYDTIKFKTWITVNNGETWNTTLNLPDDNEYPVGRTYINGAWVVNTLPTSSSSNETKQYVSFDPDLKTWRPNKQ